jgi:hypothetical protein
LTEYGKSYKYSGSVAGTCLAKLPRGFPAPQPEILLQDFSEQQQGSYAVLARQILPL